MFTNVSEESTASTFTALKLKISTHKVNPLMDASSGMRNVRPVSELRG
jgi:hypothetical protein